jgi:predicted AlkP superfamily phosphohydrolase/phosphomutase
MPPRVLVVGLDGFDPAYAARLMEGGLLPNLSALHHSGASFHLDHGGDREVGLPWEQFATGLAAADGGRQSAVRFDREHYDALQPPTHLRPFAADIGMPTVVFDMPGFDLRNAPQVQGLNGWGSHSPGIDGDQQRPAGLLDEINARFGAYPAEGLIYSIVWHDEPLARRVGAALCEGMARRTEIARWLLAERCPDWRLAMVVASEPHSAAEAFWHGVDTGHPLHLLPTAPLAADFMREVYIATDRFVGDLRRNFPDAALVAVTMHGMGANTSDVPTMALLPELLYRAAFGASGTLGNAASAGEVNLSAGQYWEMAVQARIASPRGLVRRAAIAPRPGFAARAALAASALREKLGRRAASAVGHDHDVDLTWMVAMRYRLCWPGMHAFALPSYHDGRVRINLRGRERGGLVALAGYGQALERLEALLLECTDPTSGLPVVARFDRPAPADPRQIDDTQADLLIGWRGSPVAFRHPRLGMIGPLPYRRPGGHTGGHGLALFSGPGIAHSEGGVASAFDVVPTLLDLLQAAQRPVVSGSSRIAALTRTAALVH